MQSLGLIKASLQGFSALITGGGSGIGLSTAELFAEMNANVAINYLPSDKESIKRINLLSKKFTNIHAFPGDISNAEIAERVVLQTYKKFKVCFLLLKSVSKIFKRKKRCYCKCIFNIIKWKTWNKYTLCCK